MRRRGKWIAAAAVAGIALVIGVSAVMGQTPGPTNPAGAFLDRVAQKLGVEPDDLKQAVKDTRKEDIDARVQNGDLTQEEADALKERIDSGEGVEPFGHNGFGRGFPEIPGHGPGAPRGPYGDGFHFGFGFGLPGQLDELATFLGADQAQLRTELAAEGATLATVAEAHGKSRDELKAFIADGAAGKLSEAVAAGKLTQAQADDLKAKMGEILDGLLDGEFGPGRGDRQFGFEYEFRGESEDDDPAIPVPSAPAPQSGSSSDAQRS